MVMNYRQAIPFRFICSYRKPVSTRSFSQKPSAAMASKRKRIESGTKNEIFQMKITLQRSCPSVWRRIQVPGNMNLSDLYDVFQAVMGW
jgi:hypothetical protein